MFPFQEQADIMFNSALPMNYCVETYIEPLLGAVSCDSRTIWAKPFKNL